MIHKKYHFNQFCYVNSTVVWAVWFVWGVYMVGKVEFHLGRCVSGGFHVIGLRFCAGQRVVVCSGFRGSVVRSCRTKGVLCVALRDTSGGVVIMYTVSHT